MKLQSTTAVLGLIASILFITFLPVDAFAFDMSITDGAAAARGTDHVADLFGSTGVITTVTNVLLFIIGAISVIMIIIGGLRYAVSGGNTANVTAAKNTILYAIVGLVIALFAYAMINFVITSFTAGGSGTNV